MRARTSDPRVRRLLLVLLASLVAGSPARGADPKADALRAFDTVARVLQSPRCLNCHIPGDAPLQGDAGAVHTQSVRRGAEGKGTPGLMCSDCHGEKNTPASYGAAMPPGAPGWQLPPEGQKMVFAGLSKDALCATVKDPKRNGGKDLPALLHHLEADPLVLWGWQPGSGRAPVPVPHKELVAAARKWVEAGAPCPGPLKPGSR